MDDEFDGLLAKVVLEHAAMTEFCGIPLTSLRENSITELDLRRGGVGVPGAIVLSKLLPSAAALTSLKCAPAAPKRSLLCQGPLTPLTAPTSVPVLAVCEKTTSVRKEELLSRRVSRVTRRCSRWSRPPGIEPAPECLLMCQRPLTKPTLSPIPSLTLTCSIRSNHIRAEGASALAAILEETQITTLW